MSFYKDDKIPKEVIDEEYADIIYRQVNVNEGKGIYEVWMTTWNVEDLLKRVKEYILTWVHRNPIRFGGRDHIRTSGKFHYYYLDMFHYNTTKVMVVLQINKYPETMEEGVDEIEELNKYYRKLKS